MAPLSAIRGLLIDVDDTLVDSKSGFAIAVNAVCDHYLPQLDAAGRDAALALWRADPDGHYNAFARGEITADQQRLLRANQLFERFGGPVLTEQEYAEWFKIFWTGFEAGWVAHADAHHLLDTLEACGIVYGALTNAGTDLQRKKLQAAGLERVPLLVTLDTFGMGKPDPRVFHRGAELLGVEPQHCGYVGDELAVDGLGAQNAGLRGIWLDRPGSRRAGSHLEDPAAARQAGVVVVQNLRELADLISLPKTELATGV